MEFHIQRHIWFKGLINRKQCIFCLKKKPNTDVFNKIVRTSSSLRICRTNAFNKMAVLVVSCLFSIGIGIASAAEVGIFIQRNSLVNSIVKLVLTYCSDAIVASNFLYRNNRRKIEIRRSQKKSCARQQTIFT